MIKSTPPIVWIGVGLCLLLIFGDSKGCTVLSPVAKPTYPVPAEIPITVAIAYDSSPTAVMELDKSYHGVVGAVQQWIGANKGRYTAIDTRNTEAPTYAEPWVQEAYKLIDKTKPPQIIASSPTKGIPSTPLPTTPDEAIKLLQPLVGVK